MSQEIARLVLSLPPTGLSRAVGARDRFVLVALALLVDDDETTATVGLGKLSAATEYAPGLVRTSLAIAADKGLITTTIHSSGPNTYTFNLEVLRALQPTSRSIENDSVFALGDYGMDDKPLNALCRNNISTLTTLGRLIKEWQELPSQIDSGFHSHIEAHGIGVKSGQQIVDAYRELLADHPELRNR